MLYVYMCFSSHIYTIPQENDERQIKTKNCGIHEALNVLIKILNSSDEQFSSMKTNINVIYKYELTSPVFQNAHTFFLFRRKFI